MSVSKVQSQAEALKTEAEMKKLRQRAARQAARDTADNQNIPTVECTILPMGDGKVSMGEHFAGLGDAHYEQGEPVVIQLPIAVSLYDKGYVNFEDAKKASAEARSAHLAAARQRREAERLAFEDLAEDL